jgi:hypothetical protein
MERWPGWADGSVGQIVSMAPRSLVERSWNITMPGNLVGDKRIESALARLVTEWAIEWLSLSLTPDPFSKWS